uniref:Uncharacterized protein n=1 Tax=Haptolina brevifila TaxID=156173 RepID=A0A7S2NLS3_9EUKA|mmetsp:Transcript_83089/g.165922  ORF Transcript_83089/g.165922 Transcript_83089/m.165922 type:complete len:162 (+) Transcript_83089:157-642(+)
MSTARVPSYLHVGGVHAINRRDHNGSSPLLVAASGGHEALAALLLSHPNCKPDLPDRFGCTPLSVAAASGFVKVIKSLLQSGSDPNCHDNGGDTPLMCAAKHGAVKAVEALLETGVILVNAKNEQGDTALHLVMEWASLSSLRREAEKAIVTTLQRYGARD